MTRIPDDFEHAINDASINYEHAIYSKYYDKRHLPNEEQLLSDLQKMMKLYSMLSNPKIGIREFIEKILLHNKNNENFEYYNNIFKNKFPEYLEKISNENVEENERYKCSVFEGDYPHIVIYDNHKKGNDIYGDYQYYLAYFFNKEDKKAYLSLNYSQRYLRRILEAKKEYYGLFYENDEFKNHLKSEVHNLKEHLLTNDSELENKMDFKGENSKVSSLYELGAIYTIEIILKELPPENVFMSDLISF